MLCQINQEYTKIFSGHQSIFIPETGDRNRFRNVRFYLLLEAADVSSVALKASNHKPRINQPGPFRSPPAPFPLSSLELTGQTRGYLYPQAATDRGEEHNLISVMWLNHRVMPQRHKDDQNTLQTLHPLHKNSLLYVFRNKLRY